MEASDIKLHKCINLTNFSHHTVLRSGTSFITSKKDSWYHPSGRVSSDAVLYIKEINAYVLACLNMRRK